MKEKTKLNRDHLKVLWEMRNMTVKDMLVTLSNHPDLKFLLTAAGVWWITKIILFITIFANVIYYADHIFHFVLS
jgi:hypothetical protein